MPLRSTRPLTANFRSSRSCLSLQECLEGLCTDPLAPLDFGYDLTRINAAPELDAFDSCVECGAPLASCACAAAPGRAGGAAAALGGALASTLSSRSDGSTVSRPGGSSQHSPMDAAAAAAAGMFGAAVAAAAAAAGVDGSALWRQYRPAGDRQTVLVEERLQAASAAAALRKRGADGAPEGALPPPAARPRAGEPGEPAPAPLSRRWAGSSGVGAVVTTGIAGRGSGPISTMPSLTPATPTADAALAPTMGSFIWQHAQQGSLAPAGSGMLSSGAAASSGQRPAGAVTTGLAEAAAALQRHAAAAAATAAATAAAAVKAEPSAQPSVQLTVRMPIKPAPTAAASPTQRSAPPSAHAAPSAAPLISGSDRPAGSSGSGGARATARTPRAPPARRTPRAAATSGAGEGSSRELPPIPQYREGETRADKLARYRAKRERRRFQKTVRYECRKVGGRAWAAWSLAAPLTLAVAELCSSRRCSALPPPAPPAPWQKAT